MSYARFGCDGSDVYVYVGGSEERNLWVCCGCYLSPKSRDFDTPQEMMEHLLDHRAKGHVVPDCTLRCVQEDIDDPRG